jgi:hypothetical protein
MEGQLYKYTNVMRGYQFRYFVVDAINGKLDYFMVTSFLFSFSTLGHQFIILIFKSEDMKHQRPRCTIQLHVCKLDKN